MTVQTKRNTNQVDIDLSRIKDQDVRDALAGILSLVNSFVGTGLDTEGTVKARNGIASGFADDTSLLMWKMVGRSVPADTGGEDHYDQIKVPGRVFGVAGWAQWGGTNEWRQLGRATGSDTIFVNSNAGSASTPPCHETLVVFINSDVVNANSYHAIIFYQPVEIDRQIGLL